MARILKDIGNEDTEEIIKEAEKRLAKEYQKAYDEMHQKLMEYLAKFVAEDKKQIELLNAGKITETEYKNWRYRHMMMGKRWEDMRDVLAEDLSHVHDIAKSVTRDYMPEVYAVNRNWSTYQIMHDGKMDYSFTMYNQRTVERLWKENPKLLPNPVPGSKTAKLLEEHKELVWDRKQIDSAIMQGVLQGEPINKIAERLEAVTEKGFAAAVRNARTAMTAAQNAGRQDSYEHAESIGIEMQKEWVATLDDRTRHEHRMLHGERVPVSEPWIIDGEELMEPGDPNCLDPSLVYNCRCTTKAVIKGFEGTTVTHSPKMGDMTYEEWKHAKERKKKTDAA